jgi:ribosomal protein L2
MPIKFYNPTSPGRRQGSVLDYKSVLTKFKPEKSLPKGSAAPTAATITA